MKAFLSHSSKDKGFVESVADLLRPGTYELDSVTFDAGLINSEAIIESLKRCDLFCLFLSKNSVSAPYVNFETLLGMEFFARGKIGRFLAICLDDEAFEKASANVKFFNIVRKSFEIENTARLIQGYLVSASEQRAEDDHPFIGREEELLVLERQVTDHKRPPSKALFISGNFGSGRRTIAQRFFEAQFRKVGRSFPAISIEPFAGLDELYRKILSALRPAITAKELKTRIGAFDVASNAEKVRLIAQLVNSLLPASEASLFIDNGGVLTDEGSLIPELSDVISNLESKPHPPAIFIAPRMIPTKLRRAQNDISYLALHSLKMDASHRLISKLLRDRSISIANENWIDELVKLGDGHPFNIYRMLDEIGERGVEPFLADPSDFIDWKHRQSSEYLKKISVGENEQSILGILKQLPELDFQAIVECLKIDAAEASQNLQRLAGLHIIESLEGRFFVSPPLRIAVERDRRFRLNPALQRAAINTLAQSLIVRLEEGTAPISLVDAAVLSTLESGGVIPDLAAAFLLPSHYVQLSKKHYDAKHWDECIRFAKEALKSAGRLSKDGFVAACRFMCLAAARTGAQELFDDGIGKLQAVAKDSWAKSNIAFLQGFNSRFKGNLPKAESFFRDAYNLSPGNVSAARELAAVCLARDNLDEAEIFAREAHSHARTNPYLLDTLIAVLVRKHGRSSKHNAEISELFEVLEKVGEEEGRSFFTTRKAEFEHLWGNNKTALTLIQSAINKTPKLFEPRRLAAEIYLKDGNKTKALEAINKMEEIVNARDPDERRSNYRLFLKTYSHYYVEVGMWKEAKELFDDPAVFTDEERTAAVRDIEITQGFKAR